jgi:hypothetical protein
MNPSTTRQGRRELTKLSPYSNENQQTTVETTGFWEKPEPAFTEIGQWNMIKELLPPVISRKFYHSHRGGAFDEVNYIINIHFSHYMISMVLNGPHRTVKDMRYALVAHSLENHVQYDRFCPCEHLALQDVRQVIVLQSRLNDIYEHLPVKGFFDKIVRTSLDRFDGHRYVAVTGHNKHRHPGKATLDVNEKFDPILFRHVHIRQQEIALTGMQTIETAVSFLKTGTRIACPLQGQRNQIADALIVVDNKDIRLVFLSHVTRQQTLPKPGLSSTGVPESSVPILLVASSIHIITLNQWSKCSRALSSCKAQLITKTPDNSLHSLYKIRGMLRWFPHLTASLTASSRAP